MINLIKKMNINKNNNNDLYKSNKDFAKELKRCWMILDIYYTDNIEDKIIVNKNKFQNINDNFDNKKKEQINDFNLKKKKQINNYFLSTALIFGTKSFIIL